MQTMPSDFAVVLLQSDFMLASEEYPALHQKPGYSADRSVIEDYQTHFLALKQAKLSSMKPPRSLLRGGFINRCENSHGPTRQRERCMQGCKSAGQVQRSLVALGPLSQHFRPQRHLQSASVYRDEMKNRCESWAEITGTQRAA